MNAPGRAPAPGASAPSGLAEAAAARAGAEQAERLREAERAGLRLAALCRAAALAGLAAWGIGAAPAVETRLWWGALLGGFAALGLAHRAVIGTALERRWMTFATVALDYAAIGALVALVPVSVSGEAPQIIAFRAHSVIYLTLPLALATLSLNPRLVLFAGAAGAAAWWGAFAWVATRMERTVSWSDLPPGAGRETFLGVLLDPDFIGLESRVVETLFLFSLAGILALAVHRAREMLRGQIRAEAERAVVARAFGEYVPAGAMRQILGAPGALAPRTARASVLSADLAGFTALAEGMAPAEVIACLNDFFTDAAEVVAEAGGVIVDFSGDGFIAVFNVPIAVEDPEARAVAAAIALLDRAGARDYGGRRLRLRTGIATGSVAAGAVGGAGRRTYTVYGDAVNLATRLQEMGKALHRDLLADGDTAARAGAALVPLRRGADVRGRARPVDLFARADG